MRTLILFFAASLFTVGPNEAGASCVFMPDSCKYVAEADALFEATVASIDVRQLPDGYLDRVFHLRDVRGFKGQAENIVRSNRESGHDLEVGTRYIIDAIRSPIDGLLRIRQCSLTQSLEQASGFYEFVKSLSSPPAGGYLWGSVIAREGDVHGGGYDAGPEPGRGPESESVEGALVSIVGPISLTLTTDADGRYSLSQLPEGDYMISVALPAGIPNLKPVGPQAVRLSGPRACADVSFVAYGLVRRGDAAALGDSRVAPTARVRGLARTESAADGQFALDVFADTQYRLNVSRGERIVHSVEITATGESLLVTMPVR